MQKFQNRLKNSEEKCLQFDILIKMLKELDVINYITILLWSRKHGHSVQICQYLIIDI